MQDPSHRGSEPLSCEQEQDEGRVRPPDSDMFRTFAEQTADLIAFTDGTGIITFASAASKSLFQVAPDDMSGRHFTEFLDESAIPKALAAFDRGRTGGGLAKHLELKMRRSDGSTFIGELNSSDLAAGSKSGSMVIIRDITERKDAEERIRTGLEEMAALNSLSRLLGTVASPEKVAGVSLLALPEVVHFDLALFFLRRGPDLELLRAGPAGSPFRHDSTPIHRVGECLCGLAARAGEAVYSANIHVDPRCTWEECRKGGIRSFVALPLLWEEQVLGVLGLASGSEVDFEAHAPFLEAVAGQIAIGLKNALLHEELEERAVELEREVSERRQTERFLRESEQKYRRLVERANDGIVIISEGIISFANPSAARLYGGTVDNLVGSRFIDHVDPAELPTVAERYRRRMSGEDVPSIYETVLRRTDGTSIYAELSAETTTYDGRPANLVIIRDITERRRAEEALRERDEQLRQSQKMEAIGQLAGGIAHDFNNLLTAITGYAELLLSRTDLGEAGIVSDLQEIKRAADRAAGLTRQILAFSRRQALRPEAFSLNEIVDGMEPLLRRTLGEDVELVILRHPRLGSVEVDRHQLEQVLMNLALNARDAMPGGGRLTVETANVDLDESYCRRTRDGTTPGSYVMFSVSDTGIGMDVDVLEHIFEPFFTTKGPGEGTGLGLSTVYGVVRQSGGSVAVESRPGEGTSFKVYLPRIAQSSGVAVAEAPHHASTYFGNETIMLVEDEAALRSLLERVLRGAGHAVLPFASAEDALEALDIPGCEVDLLLTDVLLPGLLQGHELAQQVLKVRPELPVLFMSGYTRDALIHAGRLDPGVHLLEKPFTPESLTAALTRVLDEAHASRGPGSDHT